MAAGMASAAVLGIGIGAMIPAGGRDSRTGPTGAADPPLVGKVDGRTLTVYENVHDVAAEITRPGMIQDVTRGDVEALYEFQTCLASGGSGTVWRAVERATGRAVAIKVIDKKLLLPSLLNMEVYAMQRCAGHPNIVELLAAFDLGPDTVNPDGEWHLVMELASGGELFARLVEHGAYSEKVAAQVIAQVAAAVYHMHSCGVCHRDIKPENVVLMSGDEEPAIKLIDFGAAVVLEVDEQVISGGRVGTWTYWAPEQANEATPYDTAVDMWWVALVVRGIRLFGWVVVGVWLPGCMYVRVSVWVGVRLNVCCGGKQGERKGKEQVKVSPSLTIRPALSSLQVGWRSSVHHALRPSPV
jgi:serine/threonine protein kinase